MNKYFYTLCLFFAFFLNFEAATAQQTLVTVLKGDVSICIGETTTLAVSKSDLTKIVWSDASSLDCDTCSSVTSFPSVTTTYFIYADSLGVTDTAQITVTVKPKYVPDIPSNATFCQEGGKLFTLNIANFDPAAQITWTQQIGTATIFNSNTAAVQFLAKSTSNWTYSTNKDGCLSNGVFSLLIPIEVTIKGNDTLRVCKGDSISLVATKKGSTREIKWNPTKGMNSATGDSVRLFTTRSGWYVAQVDDPSCKALDSVYVTVDSLPAKSLLAIAPADTLVCRGVIVALRSQLYEPEDYKLIRHRWTPKGNQLTPDSSYLMYIIANDSLPTKYVRVTQNGACVDTSSMIIRTNQVLSLKLSPDTTICEGGSAKLSVQLEPTVKDYEWKPSDGLSCTNCTNPIATPANTITYELKAKDGECPVSGKVTIKVDKINYQFPTKKNICEGESFKLNLQPNNSLKYVWKSTDPVFGTQTSADPLVQPLQSATYYVTITIGNCSKTDSLKIDVTPKQTLVLSKDTIICLGGTAVFTATPSGTGGTFLWNPNVSTTNTISFQPTTDNGVSLIYTYGNAGCVLNALSKVTVINPRSGFAFPTKLDYCLGESFVTNVSPGPKFNFLWTSNDPGFITSTQNSVTASPKANATYFLKISDTTGRCTVVDSFMVKIFDGVVKSINDTVVCLNSDITLNTTTNNATGTFSWTSSNNSLISNLKNPVVKPSENTSYFLKYSYGPGCMKFDTVKVTTLPNINPIITKRYKGKLVGDTIVVTLGDTVNLIVKLNPAINGAIFTWTGNGQPDTKIGDSVWIKTLENPTIYNLSIKTPQGCLLNINNIQIKVEVPEYDFPNVFYPESQNSPENRMFDIVLKKGNRASITMRTLKIFNRWGQLVYDNENPGSGWDGRIDGTYAASEVYTYFTEFELSSGQIIKRKGEVLLLR